jgi:hypothetical protein
VDVQSQREILTFLSLEGRMRAPENSEETIITMEEVSVSGTLKKIFFFMTLFFLMAAGYHLIFVEPLFEKLQTEGRTYYIVNMETLLDAKVAAMIGERARTGIDKTEEEIDSEMKNYVEGLREKLLELSEGSPIFTSTSVVNAKAGVVDLTPEILNQFNLVLDATFDQFLKRP